ANPGDKPPCGLGCAPGTPPFCGRGGGRGRRRGGGDDAATAAAAAGSFCRRRVRNACSSASAGEGGGCGGCCGGGGSGAVLSSRSRSRSCSVAANASSRAADASSSGTTYPPGSSTGVRRGPATDTVPIAPASASVPAKTLPCTACKRNFSPEIRGIGPRPHAPGAVIGRCDHNTSTRVGARS
ncbi:unnamed protein product, partial [Ectocarpus sp. 8 AP-2014]